MTAPVPPFNPLHVFTVAARLGSFTRAADLLGVSQAAVSRQVAVLEGYLGARLFQRERRGATLTPEGQMLQEELGPAFERIAAATERVRREARTAPVRVRVYNTFAAKWLLPRLNRFEAAHPGIAIRLSHSVTPVNFDRDPVDLSIQLGDGHWPALGSRPLLPDVLQPVCSPRLLEAGPPLHKPDDLPGHRMLVSRYRRNDWRDWLAGISRLDLLQEGMEFTSSVLTYQAAVEGLGVAIGQMPLLSQDIRAGLLVPLFDLPVRRALAYHAVWPAERPPDRKAQAFLNWLYKEVDEGEPGRMT
ncbi:LysR family transcriptional regulator, glycine cleavage system transcriptional activator [Roseomonas rosea]|uniref:LysR family transcriptional regulator, glycine cleavage system transcriptional activator n=1 Tax=Muricoccus roseus TaxID=198092 RepID=A0A1M6PZA2_9PROT|nr:LysR substrate-binding domain-containing protein [Roseomonas rosea]SHK13273.1 LysR family transcriptional regulator, glycine cleavage system transcriptional activator [Roseomonas rosea]